MSRTVFCNDCGQLTVKFCEMGCRALHLCAKCLRLAATRTDVVENVDPPCHPCAQAQTHPWHDDGSEGPNIEDHFKGGAHGTPHYYTKENDFQ